MIESAGRSRLLELRREQATARDGRALLDRKREALLRAVSERAPRLAAMRRTVAEALAAARSLLAAAQLHLGRSAIDAAVLAQPPFRTLGATDTHLVGVTLPDLHVEVGRFAPRYGPAGGSPALDRAGVAFVSLVPLVIALASQEAALRRLRGALARTVRRLNALDAIVVPELSQAIRIVTSAIEEDERDEAIRHDRWRSQSQCTRGENT